MWQRFASLWGDEDGVTAVEYGLLFALIALAASVAWHMLGRSDNPDLAHASTERARMAPYEP
jgi:hypothetical protein